MRHPNHFDSPDYQRELDLNITHYLPKIINKSSTFFISWDCSPIACFVKRSFSIDQPDGLILANKSAKL
jgi:hypothetical protein